MVIWLFICMWCASAFCAQAGDWFVSVNSTGGDGSRGDPWRLEYALTNSSLSAGDRVWLNGGVYSNLYTAYLVAGTEVSPIIFRNYNHERAIIDGRINLGNSVNNWFWGIEFVDSNKTNRTAPFATINGGSSGTKFINCLIHDCCIGIDSGGTIPGPYEAYGNIMWNCGTDSGLEHAIYWQNEGPTWKTVRNNIISNPSGFGVHLFSGGVGNLRNFVVTENTIVVTSGKASILLGGAQPYRDAFITNNACWSASGRGIQLGGGGTDSNAVVSGNVLVGKIPVMISGQVLQLIVTNNRVSTTTTPYVCVDTSLGSINQNSNVWNWNAYYSQKVDWQNNFATLTDSPDNVVGFADWKSATGFDGSSSYANSTPENAATLTANSYEAKRAHITIWNWTGMLSTNVDVSSVLSVGDSYSVINALNYFAGAVSSGIYSGGGIAIPLTDRSVSPFLYWDPGYTPYNVQTNLHVFLLLGESPHGSTWSGGSASGAVTIH